MRGQVWSADLVLSSVIFFVAMVMLIFTWNYTSEQINTQASVAEVEGVALFISDSLIRTPGLPDDWNTTNVQVIGLASKENIINKTKINRFISLDYETSKNLLGTGGHEFYFSLNHINNTVVKNEYGQNITAGTYPASNASLVMPIERYVLYDRDTKKLSFMLWVV